jgi:hypothetical protein
VEIRWNRKKVFSNPLKPRLGNDWAMKLHSCNFKENIQLKMIVP